MKQRMKKSKNEMILSLNENLNNFHTTDIRVLYYSASFIELSNGQLLKTRNECLTFRKRTVSQNVIDLGIICDLYSTIKFVRDEAKTKLKKHVASFAAKKNWELNRNDLVSKLKGRKVWNKGLTGLKGTPHTKEQKAAISERNSGSKNGMYGRVVSDEEKLHKSSLMKEKIKNGEFTPNTNNRNTNWEAMCYGKKFRSSWEALYYYHNPDSEYEKLRIEYNFKEKSYIYIVDFVNHKTKSVVEVKPNNMLNDEKTKAKIMALKSWCDEKKYDMIIFNEDYILNNIHFPSNKEAFDDSTYLKLEYLYKRFVK